MKKRKENILTKEKICFDLKESLREQTTIFHKFEKGLSGAAAGYIGEYSQKSPLNSKFYYFFYTHLPKTDLFHPCLFPQRIPRHGFFDELSRIHGLTYASKIKGIQNIISEKITLLLSLMDSLDSEGLVFLENIMNLGLRTGVKYNFSKSEILNCHHLNISLLMFHFKINQILSVEDTVPYSIFNILSELIEKKGQKKDQLYYKLITRLIVSSSRYSKTYSFSHEKKLRSLAKEAFDFYSLYYKNKKDFRAIMAASTFYRGLAMAPKAPASFVEECMLNAEKTLLSLPSPKNICEKIISDEIQLTLNLSLSKYHLYHHKNKIMAMSSLMKCFSLDRNDSAITSEIALTFYHQYSLKKSANYFKQALDQGSPALSMNAFFLGKIYTKWKDLKQAEKYFNLSYQYDDLAISPLIELHDLYKEKNNKNKMKKVKEVIFSHRELIEQLTEEEKWALNQ